ncbi:MAG: hypothetical protein QXN71_02840 [Candidatus Aenigmatarchaeota archaeon]
MSKFPALLLLLTIQEKAYAAPNIQREFENLARTGDKRHIREPIF